MKKVLLSVGAFAGIFAIGTSALFLASCKNQSGGGAPPTMVLFDNQESCPVAIFDDPSMSIKTADVGAFESVKVKAGATSHESHYFFRYDVDIAGVAIPYAGTAGFERIDAGKTTTIVIPRLENQANLKAPTDAYIRLENQYSSSTVRLKQGPSYYPSPLKGEQLVINNGETRGYKISPQTNSGFAVAVLSGGGGDVPFPASPAAFAAGNLYSFVFNGSGSFNPATTISVSSLPSVAGGTVTIREKSDNSDAKIVMLGTPLTAYYSAGGTPTYQWYKDGIKISGATVKDFTPTALPEGSGAGRYTVAVWTSAYRGIVSAPVTVARGIE
ncbi:MAG: hypothetical protein Ta2A_14680 [Treponemataceae bacterium]|nr:MAG: hypothetical protein Ta2A_14680 [Treponemataceae bacterium]